jgi:hypothetical protein
MSSKGKPSFSTTSRDTTHVSFPPRKCNGSRFKVKCQVSCRSVGPGSRYFTFLTGFVARCGATPRAPLLGVTS